MSLHDPLPSWKRRTQRRTRPEHRAAAPGRCAAARTCRSHRPPGDRCRGTGGSVGAVTTLAERLGYGPEDRLLIINCDDLGSCHAANLGTYEALRDGIATSATLMVPCPWARDAASRYRGEDVGVHLTLNAEHDTYRWGPRSEEHTSEPQSLMRNSYAVSCSKKK